MLSFLARFEWESSRCTVEYTPFSNFIGWICLQREVAGFFLLKKGFKYYRDDVFIKRFSSELNQLVLQFSVLLACS
jgi:hypothetical protein